ncbi:P-loop containing nucleoside triphosphate hydrolase protein [Viridothelium virens]|uniref:RNA helicase n=1 Tax=Viridothelium virens TaxID=1048519 RepID=A0A6A6H674_VIRVR|nr:P-loop containing nucleoside triphosphate hydrolase protein [Viridothelium virens]
MARRGDTRSPSPTESSYSRRSRREDDRYARDRKFDRGHRYRSRSRSGDRKHHDQDYRRRDRSYDKRGGRRDDDAYRSSRRDRSRDRARERSPLRDRRHRSRDRDYRDRRDDSRDRTKRRREDSVETSRKARKDDSRDGPSKVNGVKDSGTSKPPVLKSDDDEQKRLQEQRQAKLNAWKAKRQEEQAKRVEGTPNTTRSLLDEMEKKATNSPDTATSPSPGPQADSNTTATYAGKFDPKAIGKKTIDKASSSATLGSDVSVPVTAKSSSSTSLNPVPQANETVPAQPLKARGNVSGFGFSGKTHHDVDKISSKNALEMGEDEESTRKLGKLPLPILPDDDNQIQEEVLASTDGDKGADAEDDVDMTEIGTEEEEVAAARRAAEKREDRLQEQSMIDASTDRAEGAVDNKVTNGDIQMTNGFQEPSAVDHEEIDPLDAFMNDLEQTSNAPKPIKSLRDLRGKSKAKQQEPQALFNDDEDGLEAVTDGLDDVMANIAKKKKKDMPTVNHDKMNYEPFRKKFYTEPAELAEMTDDDVRNLRFRLDGIQVRGVNVPKPVTKFSQFGLGAVTLEVINKLGFTSPTPIQSQAVPAIMAGFDVIGVAKTGSGKTLAYILPAMRHIRDQRPLEGLDGPIGLIMAPTRELATQIHRDCRPFVKALGLRAVCAYGGAPIKDQIAELKQGAEIIVATPGRIIDLLAANSGRVTNLRRVTYVVLDEADRMFDMGFEPQVMKLLNNIRPDRQTILLSATFPKNMESLAKKALSKGATAEVICGGKSVVGSDIKQIVEIRPEKEKFNRTLELLGELNDVDEDARTLVFVERQDTADHLLSEIMKKGYPCNSIHGGKDQIDRDSAIGDFKSGAIPVMVATSVAARGLDVKQLKLVINYDVPNHMEDYVHRCGRTGRAGNKGTAVTFITQEQERFSVDIVKAMKQSGADVPDDVQKLADDFLVRVKAGKEHSAGFGFGGKGLERLDQERDAARTRERQLYKTGDEPEEEDKEDKDAEEPSINVKGSGAAPAEPTPSSKQPGTPVPDLDQNIVVHKTETAPASSGSGAADKLAAVNQAAAAIRGRLTQSSTLRPGVPVDNKGPDAGAYHATLEINDHPRQARWAVTNRTNVAKILEATGTSITTKGNFYAAGKTPGPTEAPKLYILVEGDTELVVTQAMRDLMRLLREGIEAAATSDARAPASGRYNVV